MSSGPANSLKCNDSDQTDQSKRTNGPDQRTKRTALFRGGPLVRTVRRVCEGGDSTLLSIASRLDRLAPSHRNPEEYHVRKSELVQELRELAKEQL
jgi:hypothetical protein